MNIVAEDIFYIFILAVVFNTIILLMLIFIKRPLEDQMRVLILIFLFLAFVSLQTLLGIQV